MRDNPIEIEIDNRKVKDRLLELAKRGAYLRPLMKNIAGIMAYSTEENFREEGRPERWLYYACLKKRIAGRGCSKQVDLCEQGKQVCETPFNAGKQAEVHSKSYKITEELFNQLKQELAPYCSSRDRKKIKGEIMKFEHILNSFNPTVTQIDLTKK